MEGKNETWRKVPNFENYEISIDTPEGRCRSLSYKGQPRKEPYYLNNKPDKRGRLSWSLFKKNIRHNKQAAVWIAITYPELVQNKWFKGAEIDHIDTDTMNNHPSNLRWVTRKENLNNPLTKKHMGEKSRGRFHSDATKQKISEAARIRYRSK